MPLELTGTWDQAVLTATVKFASEIAPSGYVGRTALQKILYFMQRSGIPMRYKFDIYHYGPYCDRIVRDVEMLVADGVLRDASADRERYSNYRPDAAASELLAAHAADLEPHFPLIRAVVQKLLPLQPEHLELLATLDYLFRQLKAGGGSGPWKELVLQRFFEVKKAKFPAEQVTAAYDSMVEANLVEN